MDLNNRDGFKKENTCGYQIKMESHSKREMDWRLFQFQLQPQVQGR
jgi:hypothetical protein